MKKIATLSLIVRLMVGCGDSSGAGSQLPAIPTATPTTTEESKDETNSSKKKEKSAEVSSETSTVASVSSEPASPKKERETARVDSESSDSVTTDSHPVALKLTSEDCEDPLDSEVKSGRRYMRCDGTWAVGTYEEPVPTPAVTVTPVAVTHQQCSDNGQINCLTNSDYKAASFTNLSASNIKSGVAVAGVTGSYSGEAQPSACTGNGQTGCLTTSTYKSADLTNAVAANIRTGITLAGVEGSFNPTVESHTDCTDNAQVGCVTTSTYQSANLTNLTAANVKANVTVAGVQGQYPSATYPLTGAISNVADLDTATFNAKIKADASFEWFDSNGTRHSASGSSNLAASNVRVDVSFFGLTGTLNPGTAPDAWDVRENIVVNGVTGLATMTCQDANADTSLNCKSTMWMQPANIGSYAIFKDRITGLRWAKVASSPVNYATTLAACANLESLEGDGWRVPSASEVRQALIHKMLSYSPTANYWGTSDNLRTWTSTYSSNSSYAFSIATNYAETSILKTDTTTIGFCVK